MNGYGAYGGRVSSVCVERVLGSLGGVRRCSGGWVARCPAHEDRQPSLAITEGGDGRVLLRCFAGCDYRAVLAALALEPSDLFPVSDRRSGTRPALPRPVTAPRPGPTRDSGERVTVAELVGRGFVPCEAWKGIRVDVLGDAGVLVSRDGVVWVPYRDRDGAPRFWKTWQPDGSPRYVPKPTTVGGLQPFGLDTLPAAPAAGGFVSGVALMVAEGESDCLAIREATRGLTDGCAPGGYVAVAIPGALAWKHEWRSLLGPFALVYVLGDGDEAGRRMNHAVGASMPRARLVPIPDGTDARELLQHGGIEALYPLLDHADRAMRDRLNPHLHPKETP